MDVSGLWWSPYQPFDIWWQEPGPADAPLYFLFVEDAEELPQVESLDGPDASTFTADHPTLKESPVRFRTSGIAAAEFARWIDRFEALTPGEIGAEQRRTRLAALRELFEAVRLPVIDIYVARSDEELRAMRLALVPGSWHLALIDYRDEGSGGRPVYASDGARVEAAGFRRGGLVALAPVLPPVELRLRDIFSLNHVPDGDFEPEEGDDSAPFDAPRPKGKPSGEVEAEVSEVPEHYRPVTVIEEQEEEQPARQEYLARSACRAPAKRHVTQTQSGGG